MILIAFALVLMAGVFVLDVLTPPEVTASALYAVVIFYASLMRGSRLIVGAGVGCSVLAFVEIFIGGTGGGAGGSPGGSPGGSVDASDIVGVNKLISLVTIWVSTALVLFVKSSVEHVEEARRRIEAESAKLETALEHAPSAMLMVDAAGTMLLVNRQAEQLFGYPRRLLLGEPVEILVPDRMRGAHLEERVGMLADAQAVPRGTSARRTARRKDGAEVPVDVALNPIETPDGLRVMVSIVDVREQLLAEELRGRAERLARELQLAEHIQTSILPRPPLAPGIELAARMLPAAEVGGDYYDVIPAADGCWIAIGDVSGHGLEAGLVALMLQSATAAILRSAPDIAPERALAGINAILYDNVRKRLGRDEFVTFSLLRYRRDGTVVHCGAHEDILVWRAATREVELHATDGPWLALAPAVQWQPHELQLGGGDLLVLVTDGLIENRDGDGQMFGLEGARRIVGERADGDAGEIVAALVAASLALGPRPEDDMTVVALRHRDA
ncbi:MAG TPA: SpoIIE family protein phosphatase [Kofleriaceae bacterium]|nr:SpoIIE family protein phosphatase [Kofleriaceae bacterium]